MDGGSRSPHGYDLQNGCVVEAIDKLRSLIDDPPGRATASGFDFAGDYQLLQTLGGALLASSRMNSASDEARGPSLRSYQGSFRKVADTDPESVPAHQGMMRIAAIACEEDSRTHRILHERFRVRRRGAICRGKSCSKA